MTTLYICYQSIFDPLTRTQVVAYLEGLAQVGFRTILLTFEPVRPSDEDATKIRRDLNAVGVGWRWLRYHKRPTLPATAWDVCCGILAGIWLVGWYGVRLVHARSHVPCVMAVALGRLTGAKVLFDVRGLMAEEYVDAGVWRPGGMLFRLTKAVERDLVRAADGVVMLTKNGETLFRRWYPREIGGKPFEVIPCCVDFRRLPAAAIEPNPAGPGAGPVTFAYVGKLGGWYLTQEMAGFVAAASAVFPKLRWRVWTQSESGPLRAAARAVGLDPGPEIGCVSPDEVARLLRQTDVGLAFIKPCLSKQASSATKVGEYLAAGIPVVATAGVGDTDETLTEPMPGGGPVGVLVRSFTLEAQTTAARELRELLQTPDLRARCRTAAEAHFHLEHIGWHRYRRLYRRLVGAGT